MSNQALHLKFELSEAVETKKKLLSTEINFINIIQKIENYSNLRREELALKEDLREKTKELISELSILLHNLPKVLEEETKFEKEIESKKDKKEKKNKKILEFELREIKRKLKELEDFS